MAQQIHRPDGADVRRLRTRIITDLRRLGELYRTPLAPAFVEGLAADLEGLLADSFLAEVAFVFFNPTNDPSHDGHRMFLAVWYEIKYGAGDGHAGGEDEDLPLFTLPAERQFDVFLRWTPSFLAAPPEDRDLSLDICSLHIRPVGLRLLRPAGGWWTHPIVYRAGVLTVTRRTYVAPEITPTSDRERET